MNLKELKTDSILVVLVLAVVLGGFWMSGKAMSERSDALTAQIEGLEMSVQQLGKAVRQSRPAPPAAKAVEATPAAEEAPATEAKPEGDAAPE